MGDQEGGGDGGKKPHGFEAEVVTEEKPDGEGEGAEEEEVLPKKVYLDPNRPDPWKRLYDEGKQFREIREKKLEKERQANIRDEMSEMKQPWTTDYAKGFARNNFDEFLQLQKQWEKTVEHNRIRKTKEVKGEKAVKDKGLCDPWQMSGGSKEIMRMKQGLYTGPTTERGYKKSIARYQRAKAGTREAHRSPPSFTPAINPNSAKMCRRLETHAAAPPAPIHERLHAMAHEKDGLWKWEEEAQELGSVAARSAEEFDVKERKGVPMELYQAKAKVRELAEALEYEHEKTRSFETLAREVQREAEYLDDALKQERERNALLALELQHERAKSDSLEIALKERMATAPTSRNIGEPLVQPSTVVRTCLETPQPLVALSLSPRRCHPYANDAGRSLRPHTASPRCPSPCEINLDDL